MGGGPSQFGQVQGIVQGVPAYCNEGGSWSSNEVLIDGKTYYTGMKYQCVEYARRYLLLTRGMVFEDVNCAFHIFELKQIRNITNNQLVSFHNYPQDGQMAPEVGDLIIYKRSMKQWWGHVAVVVSIVGDKVRLAEQNYAPHWECPQYSREAILEQIDGKWHLSNKQSHQPHQWDVNEVVLGWMRVGA